ncbi:MAG: Brp/Blh family beta-carotene 15,15'-dioxygenase [Planctomycetota bacterium]
MSTVATNSVALNQSRGAALPSPGLSWGWIARPVLIASVVPLASVIEAPWVWAASLLVIGMPHGAYDLAAIHRASQRRAGSTAAVFAVYTAIMLGCVAAFMLAPTWTLAGFLVLTAHHFGLSDSVATRGGRRHARSVHAAAFARGLVVIAAPFAFQPELAWEPFAAMSSVADDPVAVNTGAVRVAAGMIAAGGLLVVASHSIALASRSMLGEATEELVVPALVVLVSMVAPPLLVVGVYFVAVHASGHCLRAVDPVIGGGRASIRRALHIHRVSSVLLLPSVLIVVGMALGVFGSLQMESLAYAFILFCVFATLPHHLLWFFGLPGSRA